METDSIYLAGFFDGEGYVGIVKRKRSEHFTEYIVQASIGQKDGATMDWIKENFGGHVHRVKRDGSYQWIVSNQAAYKVLKRIVSYLKYKKPQAQMAIDFFEGRMGGKKVSTEELVRREGIYASLRLEKKSFTKSTSCISAGSTTKRMEPKGM